MKHLINVMLVFALLPASAFAGSACDNPGNQLAMNACAAEGHASADKELNRVYADYKKRLTGSQVRLLKKAQLAWIQFRDSSCAFESSRVEKGSAHPMVIEDCLAAKTRERVQAFKSLMSCEEGDMRCPAPK